MSRSNNPPTSDNTAVPAKLEAGLPCGFGRFLRKLVGFDGWESTETEIDGHSESICNQNVKERGIYIFPGKGGLFVLYYHFQPINEELRSVIC